MFITKRYVLVASVLVSCIHLYAQETPKLNAATGTTLNAKTVSVTGSLTDAATGKPIEGVRISYGDLYASITDSTGHFSMNVPDYNVTIRANADGYQVKEFALRGNKNIQASLFETDYPSFYGDVTTPFGIIPKSHLTTAGSSIQSRGNWSNIPETPDAFLQSKVAGLNVVRRSGTANIGANLFLRGISSLYATNQPLYIVDGVYYDNSADENSLVKGFYNNPLSYIDIRDIDNITVLKDGTSTYGSKGANGVILITTGRAKQEATKIDAAFYVGFNEAPKNLPVMNAADYRIFLSEMLQSKGLSYNEVKTLPYMNDDVSKSDYYRYHYNNNWQDKVFKNSFYQNGYLKVTGGDNIAKYGLSIGFLKNNGIIRTTDVSRYNSRFNADLNLNKHLTASTDMSYFNYYDQSLKDLGPGLTTNPIYAALIKAPFLPANDVADNGVESPTLAKADTFHVSNPVALIQSAQEINKSYRFMGSVKFNYRLNNDFSISTVIAVTVDKVRQSFFIPQVGIVSDTLYNAIVKNRSGAQVNRLFNFYNDTRVSYNKTFNRVHQFAARLGVRYNKSKSEQDFGLGYNSATDQLTSVGFGLNSLRKIGGSIGDWAWINSYLNADYNLYGKYFLSVDVAADGSSRFGKESYRGNSLATHLGDNTYALFPSISASWLMSSESFMADNKFIDLLKIRASAGLSGNDDIGNYTARKYYVSQNLLGIAGLVRGNFGNPNLQWEAVTKLNAGLDISLLKERLNISFDTYKNTTNKMIVYEPASSITGMAYSVSNSGAMNTKGWELQVNSRIINQGKFKWDVGFNVAHSTSRITKLPVNAILTSYADGTIITQAGGAPNLFYGYKTSGVYSSDAEAAAEGLLKKNVDGSATPFKGGDVRFVNTSGADKIIDESDRVIIGDPNPGYFGSITTHAVLKNWTLDALFSFSQGNEIYNYTRRQLESVSGYANQTEAVISRWRTDGQVTNVPKATWGDPMGNSRFSDHWIEDGSYIRLRTISLTYNLPFKPGFVKNASIYVTGSNLFTFTKYLGYDPEFSATSSVYGQGVDVTLEPQYRSVQTGIRVGL